MIIFLVLLLALLFFGLGFTLHLLWVVAAIVLFVWCQRTAGIPRGRTAFLQVGGQQFSKWADSSSPSGRPRRRPLQLVLLGTGARSQIAGATTGCLSGDVLGHSCPPASPSSLSARR